jgi:transposase
MRRAAAGFTKMLAKGTSAAKLAAKYGVSAAYIYMIKE